MFPLKPLRQISRNVIGISPYVSLIIQSETLANDPTWNIVIHPDKASHPKAAEAFDLLKKVRPKSPLAKNFKAHNYTGRVRVVRKGKAGKSGLYNFTSAVYGSEDVGSSYRHGGFSSKTS